MTDGARGAHDARFAHLDADTLRRMHEAHSRIGLDRRGFLRGALGAGAGVAAAAGAVTGSGLLDAAPAHATTSGAVTAVANGSGASGSFAFHGAHQAGIITPAQRSGTFVSFDVTASSRSEVRDLFRTITERSRFLTAGGRPEDVGITAPPSDSGVLGEVVPADGLTVTTSVGASLFDDRFGLAAAKPGRLRTMEDFPNDALDRTRSDGDLLLQVCAHNTDTVVHALRDLARHTRGAMQIRWREDGFVSPPRPTGTPRNLLGFKDGTANPATSDRQVMDELVWTKGGAHLGGGVVEPDWVTGGTYHVVRTIRMLVEFWDRVSIHEQENMIGRHRDSGAPLTRTHEFDDPDYVDDPTGDVIQMDAHIRLANPRTPEARKQQMLRRPYNYDRGTDADGNLDMGLLFACYQADLERQFVAVQKRLADEPLVDYISPVGGGYFFALPGVRHADDWLGRHMLT